MSETLYRMNGLCFAYGRSRVLHDIDLSLAEGRFYGIVGPNGCGKSTLLDLMAGIKRPEQGTITFREVPLASYGKRELARHLALVPQEVDCGFGYSVEEVVLMGRHPHRPRFAAPGEDDWAAVEGAMERIGILPLRHRQTTTLSGGQKQRTVVARALAQDTAVLLFDEATSSLDIKYTLHIFNLVRRLVRDEGRTAIAVVHNLNLAAAYCDELLFIKDGRVVCHGPSEETMTAANIASVFDVAAQVSIDPYSNTRQVSFDYFR
jgi:iron complex transport system ATP-binding protein